MKNMEDVALMPYVLEFFDNAELLMRDGKPAITYAFSDKNGKPAKMIKFCKEINGMQHVVVATPENKYKKLWVISEYKEQKNEDTSQPSHGDDALPPTPIAHSNNVSSNNIIAQTSKNTTKKSLNIKLSLDVDLMSILEEEYSQEENESASIIEEGFASLQNVTVDKKIMHKLAYKLKVEQYTIFDGLFNFDEN